MVINSKLPIVVVNKEKNNRNHTTCVCSIIVSLKGCRGTV